MAVLKGAEFKRCLSSVADVPEPMSSRVAALGPVELFDFEETKETQPAACGHRPCEAAAPFNTAIASYVLADL